MPSFPCRPAAVRGALTALLALAPLQAGATTEHGSFDRPPYYHGRLPAAARPIGHVAVSFRDEPGSLDLTPNRSPALAGLLDSLRVELDRLALTRPLPGGDWPMRDGPQVRFGARRGGTGPDVSLAPGEIDTREPRRMAFEYDGPGRAWKERVRHGANDSVRAVLVVQLGFADQWPRQVSWKGAKSIEIGTESRVPVPWLTSLDDPVQVLQLTGAVLTPEGKLLRLGAEGLLARRTGMLASTLGAQETLREEEIAALAEPGPDGAPAWHAALRQLVRGLCEGPIAGR
jgi:hypothetical protein